MILFAGFVLASAVYGANLTKGEGKYGETQKHDE
jgi:hypothetical protein